MVTPAHQLSMSIHGAEGQCHGKDPDIAILSVNTLSRSVGGGFLMPKHSFSRFFLWLERFRKVIRTAEAAIVVASVIGALSLTSHMMLVTVALAIGLVIGSLGIVAERNFTQSKKGLFFVLMSIGSY